MYLGVLQNMSLNKKKYFSNVQLKNKLKTQKFVDANIHINILVDRLQFL